MVMAHPLSKLLKYFSHNQGWKLGLFLILLLSISLKIQLAYQSNAFVDYDEYYTLKVVFGTFDGAESQDTIRHLWNNAELDNGNNVLYNFIAQLLTKLFGKDQMVLRFFSLFCHIVSWAILVYVLRKRNVAILYLLAGAFLFSFFPIIHQFSIITRAYSLLLLEGMLIYWLFYERVKRDLMFFFGTSILLIAAVLTHYLAVIFIVAIFLHWWIIQRRTTLISKEVIPFLVSGLAVGIYFLGHLEWFLNIGDKSKAIEATVNTTAANAMVYRQFSLEMFVQQGFSYLSKMTTGSQYFSRLAQGVFPYAGQLLFDAFSSISVLILMWLGLKRQPLKNNMAMYWIGLVFPFVMASIAQHLTGFSMKYSIVFVGWFCLLIIVQAKESRAFRSVVFINVINVSVNLITYLNYSPSQALKVNIDGVEKSYSYSELALLRIEIETAVKERGAFEFHDQQEITFVKTLIPDHKDEWKLNQVESAGLVTLQALK